MIQCYAVTIIKNKMFCSIGNPVITAVISFHIVAIDKSYRSVLIEPCQLDEDNSAKTIEVESHAVLNVLTTTHWIPVLHSCHRRRFLFGNAIVNIVYCEPQKGKRIDKHECVFYAVKEFSRTIV